MDYIQGYNYVPPGRNGMNPYSYDPHMYMNPGVHPPHSQVNPPINPQESSQISQQEQTKNRQQNPYGMDYQRYGAMYNPP